MHNLSSHISCQLKPFADERNIFIVAVYTYFSFQHFYFLTGNGKVGTGGDMTSR